MMKQSGLLYEISHFEHARVLTTPQDENIVGMTYESFVHGLSMVTEYFDLKIDLPFFNIFVAPDRRNYDHFVSHLTPTPTNKGRVGQPQLVDLYLLSPNSYRKDADEFYWKGTDDFDKDVYRRLLFHETVHMIEEFISPKGVMAIRPQWWSEGLAVYLSQQYLLDSDIKSYIKLHITERRVPHLNDLHGANAYTWGWSVVKYIEEKTSRTAIRDFMMNSKTNNVLHHFDLEENDWHKFAYQVATGLF